MNNNTKGKDVRERVRELEDWIYHMAYLTDEDVPTPEGVKKWVMERLGKVELRKENEELKAELSRIRGISVENLARQLHEWYLSATDNISTESYNPKAKIPYENLSAEQKYIDKYIAIQVHKLYGGGYDKAGA